MRHGRGIKVYKSGKMYDGMWENDKRTGEGKVSILTEPLVLNEPEEYLAPTLIESKISLE